MKKIALVISVAILATALGFSLYLNRAQMPEPVMPVAPISRSEPVAVNFELADLDGKVRNISEWHGKHRIINFWATWCAPCRREIPLLKAFQDQHGAENFQVIGIAVEFPGPVVAYAEQAQFNYPILVGEQDAMAAAESSGVSFIGLPFTMVVTRDGILVGAHMGEIHQQQLDSFVEVLDRLDRGEIDLEGARTAARLL
ncbi:MAG: TlpA family protein disulfide reductase [Gammaproteobacteria bacterium]|nr:TlpA family protein disulfide reductase [Gammaproteobacteria bacterium]MDH5304004.1 TlpA family protein disulfide reductase [Gammaproteobacteria bacterium]MDH5321938.1 TlpA family protein disulfide reductase [Gammaproteobacteria bacterium]